MEQYFQCGGVPAVGGCGHRQSSGTWGGCGRSRGAAGRLGGVESPPPPGTGSPPQGWGSASGPWSGSTPPRWRSHWGGRTMYTLRLSASSHPKLHSHYHFQIWPENLSIPTSLLPSSQLLCLQLMIDLLIDFIFFDFVRWSFVSRKAPVNKMHHYYYYYYYYYYTLF